MPNSDVTQKKKTSLLPKKSPNQNTYTQNPTKQNNKPKPKNPKTAEKEIFEGQIN